MRELKCGHQGGSDSCRDSGLRDAKTGLVWCANYLENVGGTPQHPAVTEFHATLVPELPQT